MFLKVGISRIRVVVAACDVADCNTCGLFFWEPLSAASFAPAYHPTPILSVADVHTRRSENVNGNPAPLISILFCSSHVRSQPSKFSVPVLPTIHLQSEKILLLSFLHGRSISVCSHYHRLRRCNLAFNLCSAAPSAFDIVYYSSQETQSQVCLLR